MSFRIYFCLTVIGLAAMLADASEFCRIVSFGSMGDGGRLMLEDWDGDGKLELLRGNQVDEFGTGRIGRYITFTQVYEINRGVWAIGHGYMHHSRQIYNTRSNRINRDEVEYTIAGDFNDDGIEDMLVAEPESPGATTGNTAEFRLRLKQAGEILYEDTLDGVYKGPDDNFERFELLDIDGDGVQEVLVWILSYRENDRLIVYGKDSSTWHSNQNYDVSNQLDEALSILAGIQAARPDLPCPVEVTMEPLKDTDVPAFVHPKIPEAKRFRLTFKARSGREDVDLDAWRDYFQKWAIAYTWESESGFRETPIHSSWGLYMEPEGAGLLAAIGIRETEGKKPVGWFRYWLECAIAGKGSKPFQWAGTLRTNKAMVRLDNPIQGKDGVP